MEKIYDKIENLKNALNESELIKSLRTSDINRNKELLSLIERYNQTSCESIRQEIINNNDYQEYKHLEAELNMLILEINQELKKITKKDQCGL